MIDIINSANREPKMLDERHFHPFAITKPNEMGIGLAVSSLIIESHKGRLAMVPDQNTGTAFPFIPPAAKRMVD